MRLSLAELAKEDLNKENFLGVFLIGMATPLSFRNNLSPIEREAIKIRTV